MSIRILPPKVVHQRVALFLAAGLLLVHAAPDLAPTALGQEIGEQEQAAFKAAVDIIAPSVVHIETVGGGQLAGDDNSETNVTSGVVVTEDGLVITSQFALMEPETSSIIVTRSDGKRSAATIVARDHSRSLVALKTNFAEKFVVPPAVPLDQIQVGQWAIAVGRTFDASKVNRSVGIVSALDRIWSKALQTDAKISPNNYGGALIDIEGRVLGILAPLSPNSQEAVAGNEWYDGGIGFAVPLAEILPHLEQLKQGHDLHAGLLGISYKGEDPFAGPVEVAACSPKSPAYKVGVRAGDRIVELNGHPIEMVAQLRHAMGKLYAGTTVQLVVQRGEERLPFQLELAEKIEPYERPFLGILPERREGDPAGTTIRFVFPESAAAKAGLQAGDLIVNCNNQAIANANELRSAIAALEVGQKISLDRFREGESAKVDLELQGQSTEVPAELPPVAEVAKTNEAKPALGVVDIQLPEERNECFAYVPEGYEPTRPLGLIVWLHAPQNYERNTLVEFWKPLADKHQFILLAPASLNPTRWDMGDAAFVRKAVDQIVANYRIDRTRVVAHGFQAGGTMAYFVAVSQREIFTGVAPVDASYPSRLRLPDNDPVYPLSVYSVVMEKSPVAKAVAAGVERLEKAKYPVVERQMAGEPRNMNAEEMPEFLRWFDALDRI